MKYLYLIPEELKNAKLVNDELGDVARASASNVAYLVFNMVILILGGVLGFFCIDKVDDNLLNAVITFSGVIIGFVITAMLFSGRSQYVGKMTYEQTYLYGLKVKYMLMSQMNTLFSFLICLGFSLLSMLAIKMNVFYGKSIPLVMSSGFFVLGCYRMMLLPFQIYDVHSLALDSLLEESRGDVKSAVKSASEARLRKVI
ncbi:hypothetical protein JFV30_22795 [Pseudomonas sp. TH32]|uniref:hypothetical protein n=1 Tax=Pseudomonas sp. TH32 TaxID=2796397 RepID=UPI001914582E|nr:hypothetical protein [Pseudomonas sp. TH32]MBK5439526.1 hypothetical protein [Pseudomonas sp. TH32]